MCTSPHNLKHPLQCWAVGIAAGEAANVIFGPNQRPAGMRLAPDRLLVGWLGGRPALLGLSKLMGGGEVEGMTISDKPKPPFDRAAKKALAEERAIEGAKAMTEYKTEGEAERAKTRA
jgi:hypothetical protein